LETFRGDVLLKIVDEVLQEVESLVNDRLQKRSGAATTIEWISNELRKIPVALSGRTKTRTHHG
ncbi:MAG: hypothetical protein ACRDF4_06395, partial [Rhabdochlamydiaceae bacterium]